MSQENPCLTCGACCAHYRVSFYWGESDPAHGGEVPAALTEDVNDFYRCMQGTNQKHPRCMALNGDVGKMVSCAIYAQRPSPCREFGIHWADGALSSAPDELARCNQARAAWGLPPLTIEGDFQPDHKPEPFDHAA